MRIVHVTDAYLPKLGGIERQVSELARRQSEAGHRVTVVTRASGPGDRTGEVRLERVGSGPAPWHWSSTAREVSELVRRSRPDVVHCHLSLVSPAALVGLRAATAAGVPAVATYHSVLPARPRPWLPLRHLPLRVEAVDWTAVSQVAADSVSRLLGDDIPVHLLPNGVDGGRWTLPARRPDPGELVVVWVGRVTARKRPFAALQVVARAQAQIDRHGGGPRVRLDVVGSGPWRRAAASRARRLLPGQVRWLGSLDSSGVRAALAGADLFLATATAESFGIAAMEARAGGLPVVARRGTGLAELIEDGVSGLLADDVAGLADAVVRLAPAPLRCAISNHNRSVPAPARWSESLHRADLAYKRAADLVTVDR